MGMFDTVRWHFPLPGILSSTEIEFQTKDSPDQCLASLTVTEQGLLVYPGGKVLDDWSGALTFSVVQAPLDEEYVALFVKGKLQMVCNISTGQRTMPGG